MHDSVFFIISGTKKQKTGIVCLKRNDQKSVGLILSRKPYVSSKGEINGVRIELGQCS